MSLLAPPGLACTYSPCIELLKPAFGSKRLEHLPLEHDRRCLRPCAHTGLLPHRKQTDLPVTAVPLLDIKNIRLSNADWS